jgi:hypothetical protein
MDRDEALDLLLAAASRSRGGRGMALIDGSGRMLAAGGPAREAWEAARAARRGAALDGFSYADVAFGGERMRLIAVEPSNGAALERTAAGLTRILSTLV